MTTTNVIEPGKENVLAALQAGVLNLCSSEEWMRYLSTQAKFRRYSFQNTMLIALQRPDATQVAGFHAWRKLGRSVRKGEKGIKILAPRIGKDDDGEKVVRGFMTVTVFDVAQTDGEDLPAAPVEHLSGDDAFGWFSHLLDYAVGLGWTVDIEADLGGPNGSASHDQKRISIQAGMSGQQKVKTFAHELGHALLHGPEDRPPREVCEVEAESVAFVVCEALGIASDDYSFGYVASWAGQTDAVDIISASGRRIQKAARLILDAVLPAAEQEDAQ